MRNRRWLKWALIAAGVVIVLVVAVPFVYINFIRDDAPPKLSLDDVSSQTTTPDPTSATGDPDPSASADIAGTYKANRDSTAGYRAKEVLFGQDAEAAGRTNDVSGTVVVDGTTIKSADFTVEMASVTSDQDRRDSQFRGRIMDVEQFPTATFTLTSPITLDAIPDIGKEITVKATGDFTLRGVTKSVTFDLSAKRTDADSIAVQGDIPITWSDWSIPEPSFGPAQVADNGEIEFLLVLDR
jgi:polyisoprenoid-binding protein YceI